MKLITLLSLLLLLSMPVRAIDRIILRADGVRVAQGADASNVRISLQFDRQNAASLRIEADQLQGVWPNGPLQALQLRCGSLLISEPRFECLNGLIALQAPRLGKLQARVNTTYHSTRGQLTLRVQQLALAGGSLTAAAQLTGRKWQAQATGAGLTLEKLVPLLQQWWQPPRDLSYSGSVQIGVTATGQAQQIESAAVSAQVDKLSFQNRSGDIVAEDARLELTGQASGDLAAPRWSLQLRGLGGQVLGGPVLLDFNAHPLQVQAEGQLQGRLLDVARFNLQQSGLLDASGSAQLDFSGAPLLQSAAVSVAALEFPAAYTSLLQLTLATTDFGNLQTSGRASGQIELRANRPIGADLRLEAVSFNDARKGLRVERLSGDLHWRARGGAAPPGSLLRWQRLQAYGLQGGSAELKFHAQGADFSVDEPTRLPLFDGALFIQRLVAREVGGAAASIGFDGTIEPISMERISEAFGWPQMSGTVSGRIPGLELQQGTVRVAGDVSAQIFDGAIAARNLQVRDLLGRFPRFSADLSARGLDLALITRTFPIGSITGRLDADVRGLELFGRSPTAFDARLYTTPGDRSRHRISQKAVDSLAKIGGGGGGVAAALQGGLLRFFDDFGYDRIGISCHLSNDVCEMGGIAPAGSGYYIVRGGGLPRIDIIGNSRRVAWTRLLAQINAAIETQSVVVQ